MSAKITTPFGHPVPPAPRHSVTVHMGPWENAEKYGADSRSVIASFKNAYPRMKPHKDIASVSSTTYAIRCHEVKLANAFCSLLRPS